MRKMLISNAEEEIGYEKRIVHELDAIHQRRCRRYEAVEHDTGEERPDDRFEPCRLGEERGGEYQCQHENVLQHAVAVFFEEPAGESWKSV